MHGPSFAKKPPYWIVAFCVIVALLSEAVARAGWLQGLETAYGDLSFRLAGQRTQVSHVALVELDDQTLAMHPDDPLVFWTPHFARALQILHDELSVTMGLCGEKDIKAVGRHNIMCPAPAFAIPPATEKLS